MDVNDLIEPYKIEKARQRYHLFDPIIRYMWECNEVLKHEIEVSSYSGYGSTDVDIATHSNEINFLVTTQLEAKYRRAGYKTKIDKLEIWGVTKSIGYRLTVSWEE